jgi:hypothetical protein
MSICHIGVGNDDPKQCTEQAMFPAVRAPLAFHLEQSLPEMIMDIYSREMTKKHLYHYRSSNMNLMNTVSRATIHIDYFVSGPDTVSRARQCGSYIGYNHLDFLVVPPNCSHRQGNLVTDEIFSGISRYPATSRLSSSHSSIMPSLDSRLGEQRMGCLHTSHKNWTQNGFHSNESSYKRTVCDHYTAGSFPMGSRLATFGG